jgi:membrane-associated phospholipid phosphatase
MNIGIKDVLFKIRWFFIPYLLVLCACFTIKFLYTRPEIYFWINGRYSAFGDFIMPYLTDLGNGLSTVLITLVILLFSYRKALLMGTTYALVSGIIVQVVKFIFDAPRPTLYFKDQLSRIHLVQGVEMLKLHSFPSGHTATAFASTVVITYWCKNKGWGLPLLIVAMSVAYSRMYMSEHFFEDVTGGSAIGVICTVLWIAWFDNLKFMQSPKWNRGLLKLTWGIKL